MKKIYTSMALLLNCALISAAVPADLPEATPEVVANINMMTSPVGDATPCFIQSIPYDADMFVPARVQGKTPKRVSADESIFDFNTNLLMGNTTRMLVANEAGQSSFITTGILGFSTPVEDKPNTYELNCFNIFKQIESLTAVGTLDPETGIFTIDHNRVAGQVTMGNATYNLYFKGMKINDQNMSVVDPDAAVEFELTEAALRQINESIMLAAEVSPGKWSFLTSYNNSLIGVSTGIGSHTLTRTVNVGDGTREVSEQTSYTMFADAYDGSHLVLLNAFNFGSYEYATVATFDEGYLVYNDQTIWTMYDGDTPFPLVIYPKNGPSAEGEVEYINQSTKVTFDPLVAVVDYNNQLLIQATFTAYDANAGGPEWQFIFDLEKRLAFTPQIESEGSDLPVEYFNLQGVKVANPSHGIYVRRQGDKVTKVAIR